MNNCSGAHFFFFIIYFYTIYMYIVLLQCNKEWFLIFFSIKTITKTNVNNFFINYSNKKYSITNFASRLPGIFYLIASEQYLNAHYFFSSACRKSHDKYFYNHRASYCRWILHKYHDLSNKWIILTWLSWVIQQILTSQTRYKSSVLLIINIYSWVKFKNCFNMQLSNLKKGNIFVKLFFFF